MTILQAVAAGLENKVIQSDTIIKNLESLHGKEFVTIDGKKTTLLTMNIHENIELDIPLGRFTCTEVTPTNVNKQTY